MRYLRIMIRSQVLQGTHASLNEAVATLEGKRSEEASSRAMLADTYKDQRAREQDRAGTVSQE